jgi:penicillin-binding protein 2
MTWFHPHDVARRMELGRLTAIAVFGVLLFAFFRLQVLGAERFETESRENRLRSLPLPAPRGLIMDRSGNVLAENVPGYSIAVLPSDPDSLRGALQQIAMLTGLDSLRIEALLRRYRSSPHEPLVVRRDASFEVISALEESRVTIPGLVIQSEPKRRYPYGEIAAHVVGYVGEITEEELASNRIANARGGTLVGRDGLERQYDERLRGEDGWRFIEVDAMGRTVREMGDASKLVPEQGDTVVTSLDIGLQQFVAEIFPEGRRGSVVAMDPRTGEVLALYSAPSFDPDLFVGGMAPELWQALSQAEDQPLFNRAIEGRYPPASPWKLAVAASALRRGVATMETRMETPCTGGMLYGNRYFRCWDERGHGDITLREAIQHSCDVYFYQLGLRISLDGLLRDGVSMGFTERSGIDLPDESTPLFPATTAYYDRRYGPRGWTSGVTLNLAIGQGENTQSVINMVKFYAMLANNSGVAPVPRLVNASATEPHSLELTTDQLEELRDALFLVVERGTAVGARVEELQIAGKTGTAQNPQGPEHGWFIGFAPVEQPEIVVGAIVEFAEHGSNVAPLVTRVIRRHLVGPDSDRDQVRLVLPADSAPGPVPILPDSSQLRRTRGTG